MLRWQHYPRSLPPSALGKSLIAIIQANHTAIDSHSNDFDSNAVLAALADPLRSIGFLIERGKKKDDKIAIPVLFGQNGRIDKAW